MSVNHSVLAVFKGSNNQNNDEGIGLTSGNDHISSVKPTPFCRFGDAYVEIRVMEAVMPPKCNMYEK